MSTALQSVGVFLLGLASGVAGSALWPASPVPATAAKPVDADSALAQPSQELTALLEAVEVLTSKVDALGHTVTAEASERVPVEPRNPEVDPLHQTLADLSRRMNELSSLVTSSIDRGTPFIPWKGSREMRFDPINPADVSRLNPDELNELMRARSFEDVFRDLGQPSRIWTHGTRLQCEFTLPDGEMIGMNFINGRVVEAYE